MPSSTPASSDLESLILTWANTQRTSLDELASRVHVTVPRLLADLRRGTVGEAQLRTIMAALRVPPEQERAFLDNALTRRAARRVAVRFAKVEGDMRQLRSAINAFVGRASGGR